MIREAYKRRLTACVAQSLGLVLNLAFSPKSTADEPQEPPATAGNTMDSGNYLFPSHAAVALGVGLRPRLLFGQETFYQESWSASAAAHWKCRVVENCELLGRVWYQRSMMMPEDNGELGLTRSDADLGMELGIESRALFLSGISLGLVSSERKYMLNIASNIINNSGAKDFREVIRYPSARLWLGVSLWPESVDLILSLSRGFSEDPDAEKQSYASEIRVSF
ncbi:MAG: hypothetical protein RI932_1353 [Pseudomonadota bacterium]|jgi:hypothetical protein